MMNRTTKYNMHDDIAHSFEQMESPQSSKLQHMLRSGGGAQSRGPAHKYKSKRDRSQVTRDGRQSGVTSALDEIVDFNASSMSKFNPEYSECEQQFISTLEGFQNEVNKLQEMQDFAIEMVKGFNDQVSSSQTSLDIDVRELRKWNPPVERLRTMQERVSQLKAVMNKSREKLVELDKDVGLFEETSTQEKERSPFTRIIILSVFVLVLSLVILKIWKRF